MAGFIVSKNMGGDPPEIEDGMHLAIFLGIRETEHPDWAGVNSFGKEDNGDRYAFDYELRSLDTGEVIYDTREKYEGDALNISREVSRAWGERSNAYKLLKPVLTKAEAALFDAGEPFDLEAVFGRPCVVVIKHSEKGWPQIDNVIVANAKQTALVAK